LLACLLACITPCQAMIIAEFIRFAMLRAFSRECTTPQQYLMDGLLLLRISHISAARFSQSVLVTLSVWFRRAS
jgi:hypothetical protein